jgi:chorismate mutase
MGNCANHFAPVFLFFVLLVNEFHYLIRNDGKIIRLIAERIYLSDQVEKYKVTARNKSLTLQSNRPLMRKKNLRYRRPNWKLIEGQLYNSAVLEKIIDALESWLKSDEAKNNGLF